MRHRRHPHRGVFRLAVLGLGVALLAAGPARAASLPPVESSTGLVVSAQHLAAEAGVEMLRRGGNAIDAAVAVGYAEAVVNPCCGNIGGGGFLTAHMADGRDVFVNFRETAPASASRDMYLDSAGKPVRGASLYGWKAVAVPGSVAGLDAALVRYGTMSRAAVLAPAIRLAREGFVLEPADADILAHGAALLRRDPAAARIFLHADGSPLQAGERLTQRDLANTLQAIADYGPDAFYKGPVASAVAAASSGAITAADLGGYRAVVGSPLSCVYRGYQVLSAPPPSSGGVTLCETLNILEGYDLRGMGFHGADSVHAMIEALRLSFLDRNTSLGDPAFDEIPFARLLSKQYAERLRGTIGDGATPSSTLGPGAPGAPEKPETTHFSVIDKDGSGVAVTFTINGAFGAGVIAGDTGFLLNDEMDDFTLKAGTPNQFGLVQGGANTISPNKRPLSSMAPTVVLRDGAVMMVAGSPGGPRIITATLEAILNVIDYGMTAQEAVDAPRLHHQMLPDVVFAEPFALSPDTQALLTRMGYHIQEQKPWGAVALIVSGAMKRADTRAAPADSATNHAARDGVFYGANDPRRPAGAALAP